MGEVETFHVSAAIQCSIYDNIYLSKRRPQSRAAYASRINNKRPALQYNKRRTIETFTILSEQNERHMGTFKAHNINKQFTITVANGLKK